MSAPADPAGGDAVALPVTAFRRSPFVILAVILAAQTAANIGPLGIPAIAPLIRDDLGLTLAQAGSFLSAYYVGPILMSIPAGALSARFGLLATIVAGQLLIAGGLFAVSAADTYAVLIVLMIVAGLGYGVLNPTSTTAVINWFPFERRATAVGIKQVGLPFGGAIGAVALPWLAFALGWRPGVVVSAAAICVVAAVSAVVYRDPPSQRQARAAGAPRVREVLRQRALWLVSLASLIFAAMQTVWMAYLVLYLREHVGLSVVAAAGYLAQAQITGMLGRIVFGVLSDRAFHGGRRIVLVIAACGSTLCTVAIALTGPGVSAVWLSTIALAFGFFGIGWNGVQHTLMAELAGSRDATTAVGLGLAMSSIGVMIGPPIFGAFVERAGSFQGPWLGLALTMGLTLALLARVRERPHNLTHA